MAGRNHHGEPFAGGLFLLFIFGFIFFRHSWSFFWFFPLLFLGIIPLLRRLGSSRRSGDPLDEENEIRDQRDKDSSEKQVLKAAKVNGGVVTPALVALDSTLSIEEAEKMLQSLVQRGYATMEVTDSGQIEYRFQEFLPPTGGSQ
ncbi:MAG: hypothetical protein JW760_15370 [Spirochaetales bacterium]|nr:hypothetical protein [Spirochaetales bacterium]